MEALQSFLLDPTNQVTKADKGDSFALMDIAQYLQLAYKHLDDPVWPVLIEPHPGDSGRFVIILAHLLETGIIDHVTIDFLCRATPVRT